ncbi:MAG: transposase [Clostridia bacterium]|nr:transposase [Clostridia bacterium]MBR3324942.1 transposase [Clostridia bacterium]
MPRISRESLIGKNVFHVMTQGIKKENIFKYERKKYEYIKLMKKLKDDYNIKLISYCMMDNHAHILINTSKIKSMTEFMHKLNTLYGIYYNKSLDRIGYVFRNRFETQPIINISYLHNCILYIHNNPVKAGICENAKQYKFSSYYYFYKENNNIFKRLFKNLNEYNMAHKRAIRKVYLIEDEDDVKREIVSEITEYLRLNKRNKIELKADKELLKPIAKRLKNIYGLSNEKNGKYLDVSREKIRYILK